MFGVESRRGVINSIASRFEGRLLEIGCALNSVINQSDEYAIFGLDVFPPHNRTLNKRFCLADAEFIPFKRSQFDIIIAGELIEHLPDPRIFLRECHHVLKPSGHLILSTPNKKSYIDRIFGLNYPEEQSSNLLGKMVRSRFIKGAVGYKSSPPAEYDDYRHKNIFDREQLSSLCQGENLFLVQAFYTALYYGWDSKLGRMISFIKALMHRLLPLSLHECMILLLVRK